MIFPLRVLGRSVTMYCGSVELQGRRHESIGPIIEMKGTLLGRVEDKSSRMSGEPLTIFLGAAKGPITFLT